MFSKILFAVDDSEHSAGAVAKATELGESSGADVLVFHVRELLPVRPAAYDIECHRGDRGRGKRAEEQGRQGQRRTGARYYGYNPRLIVEAAKQFGADVIVMGSRGRSDLPSLLLATER
jgi:nucleotide-binding universal stress UspA family protein